MISEQDIAIYKEGNDGGAVFDTIVIIDMIWVYPIPPLNPA